MSKYKAVIIDDEQIIRDGLTRMIDWASFDIEIVGTAADGNTGFELICAVSPDLILTDIRMPGITGLDLLAAMHASGIPTPVILITGYDDFAYVKQALQLGALNYILKPVDVNELHSTVRDCTQYIENQRAARHKQQQVAAALQEMSNSYGHYVLLQYIKGVERNRELIDHYPPPGVIISGANMLCVGRLLLSAQMFGEIPPPSANVLKAHLLRTYTAEDLLVLCDADEVLLMFLSSDMDKLALLKRAKSISTAMVQDALDHYQARVLVGLSDTCGNIDELPSAYAAAGDACGYAQLDVSGQVVQVRDIDFSCESLCDLIARRLKNDMQHSDKEAFEQYMCSVFSSSGGATLDQLKLLWIGICARLCAELDHLPSLNKQALLAVNTPEVLLTHVIQLLGPGFTRSSAGEHNQARVIKRSIEYINLHYGEPLTLHDLASRVYLSDSRFSTLFSREVGEPFSRYLIHVRISAAKRLLANPFAKIYQIAADVGFNDPRYFSTLFKKIEGVTPVQYMNRIEDDFFVNEG